MTIPQPYGLSAEGFKSKRLDVIVENLNAAMQAQFGNINVAPQSVFGQIIGVMAKAYSDVWENLNFIYASQYPNSALGISLDNVVALNGLTRLPESQTQVWASCFGNEGTAINANALAGIPNTNSVFYAVEGGIITQGTADFAQIAIDTLAPQTYTVVLNSKQYIYSLPIITFTGGFALGNDTTVYINGIAQPVVPFNTDTNTTVMDIAAQIALDTANVLSATPVANVINIVPVLGKQVVISAISIAGGAPPTAAITFATPATLNAISTNLTAVINAGTPTWLATNLTGSLKIVALDKVVPFAIALGTNLTLSSFSTPISFKSQEFGPIPCPVGALTTIITPIGGWTSVTNTIIGTLGRFTETDAQLRLRRAQSINLFGLATVPAIRAHLINLENVTAVSVEENVSLIETNMVITFSDAIIAGQQIDVSYNLGAGTFSVPFNTDMATTMADLAAAFLAMPQAATAVVSGGNLVLTLTFNPVQTLIITTGNVTVSGTGTLPTAVVIGGQPGKSVQATVQGGDNTMIAEEIWATKPAGILTFGNTNVTFEDSQGIEQNISFSRPIPVYLWVSASLTLYTEENYPINGDELVAQAIFAYGNSLGVGFDVLIQRVESQVFLVPGIGAVTMQLAQTSTADGSPLFAGADIPIASNQISAWDLQRIAVQVI